MRSIVGKISVTLAVLFCVCLCAGIIYGGIWLHKIESFSPPVIPTPKMPPNNAFDSFAAAGAKLTDRLAIEDESDGSKKLTTQQKKSVVAANSSALAKLASGLSDPYCGPPLRSFNQKLPYLRQFRNLARLLSLRAQVEEADGQWQQAAESSLDAIQMGEMIPHGSELIGDLVGDACEAAGRGSLWPAITHLNSTEARADILRLKSIQAQEVSLSDVLQQEEWTGQAGMAELARKDTRLQSNPIASVFWRAGLYDYTQYMNQLIRNARLPYGARPAAPTEPRDVFVAVMAPVFAPAGVKYADNATQDDLLLASLALHAYKLDHGVYPATLGQLAPAYLERIPNDPFALNTPLHYRRAGATYVLYSVGPDGIDNGGEPITNSYSYNSIRLKKTVADKPNHNVEPDSKGDIVAGVNM